MRILLLAFLLPAFAAAEDHCRLNMSRYNLRVVNAVLPILGGRSSNKDLHIWEINSIVLQAEEIIDKEFKPASVVCNLYKSLVHQMTFLVHGISQYAKKYNALKSMNGTDITAEETGKKKELEQELSKIKQFFDELKIAEKFNAWRLDVNKAVENAQKDPKTGRKKVCRIVCFGCSVDADTEVPCTLKYGVVMALSEQLVSMFGSYGY